MRKKLILPPGYLFSASYCTYCGKRFRIIGNTYRILGAQGHIKICRKKHNGEPIQDLSEEYIY